MHPKDPEALVRAKKSFNESKRKLTITFEELLELFNNTCESGGSIARKIGCSREQVRQIFKKYFVGIVPRKSLGHRQQICSLKKVVVKIREMEKVIHPDLEWIAAEAINQGFSVKSSVSRHKTQIRTLQTELVIGTKLCKVHFLSSSNKTSRKSKAKYFLFNIPGNLGGYQAVIVVLNQEDSLVRKVYIIPSSFLELLKEQTSHLYFRSNKPVFHIKKSLINDLEEFANAWHILK